MEIKKFISLENLEVYKLARELSNLGWKIYQELNWQDKKIMGDQFIASTDSVGANIAEGYFRYHFLEKIKFYYISRGSLAECAEHWIELLLKGLSLKINNFIGSTYKAKNSKSI